MAKDPDEDGFLQPGLGTRTARSKFLEAVKAAAALCPIALFLGYFGLAGIDYVSILLLADASFVVATSVLPLKDRRVFGGNGRNAAVSAGDVSPG
jgi:hypothetical protein